MVKLKVGDEVYEAESIDSKIDVDYARLYNNSAKIADQAIRDGNYRVALFWQENAIRQYRKMSYDNRVFQFGSYKALRGGHDYILSEMKK